LIQVTLDNCIDRESIRADLWQVVVNNVVVNAGMGFYRGNGRHSARSPLALRVKGCILFGESRSPWPQVFLNASEHQDLAIIVL